MKRSQELKSNNNNTEAEKEVGRINLTESETETGSAQSRFLPLGSRTRKSERCNPLLVRKGVATVEMGVVERQVRVCVWSRRVMEKKTVARMVREER